MFKQKTLRNQLLVSTIVFLDLVAIFAIVYLSLLEDTGELYLWVGLGIITTFYFMFQFYLLLNNNNSTFRNRRKSPLGGNLPPSF